MNSNLENFKPKLRSGRVIPQGARIIFEADDPYNQISLPMALADMILLCSGQFSVREIVEKVYKKQGAVPFKAMLTAIHLLHRGGFFANGEELVLSSHLKSWMAPQTYKFSLSLRLWQKISVRSHSPTIFYGLTLLALILSIFGLQYWPENLAAFAMNWSGSESPVRNLLVLAACIGLLRSWRFLLCGLQLLLLTGKVYNVGFRLSPWGVNLHVGDEANNLFENRLYITMYHVSQILAPWFPVFVFGGLLPESWFQGAVLASTALSFWELNPFLESEGRKLIRALMLPSDRDVASWHFESSNVVNSINPESRRLDQDFARACAMWGAAWLVMVSLLLHQLATVFGPSVLAQITHFSMASVVPALGLTAWLGALYYVVQSSLEVMIASVIRPYWRALFQRLRSYAAPPRREWAAKELIQQIEGLPLFSHFHEQYLEKLVVGAQVQGFEPGAVIIREGEPARELFVLLEGSVRVSRHGPNPANSWSTELNAVSVFGEAALVDDAPRAAECGAKTAVTVLRVPVSLIRQVALEAQSVRHLEVFRNAIMVNQFFASSPVFRSLSPSSVEFLISRGTLEYFDENQPVFNQGDMGESLFLILRGSVSVEVHELPVKRLQQGSFFGEIALIASIPRTATIRACEPSVFFRIGADAFWEVLVQNMDLGVFIETVSETRLKEDLALTIPVRPTGTDSL